MLAGSCDNVSIACGVATVEGGNPVILEAVVWCPATACSSVLRAETVAGNDVISAIAARAAGVVSH